MPHPCLSLEELRVLPALQRAEQHLQQQVSATRDYFNALYMPVLQQLALFCQAMPQSTSGAYAHPYGLFEQAVARCLAALKLRQGELMPQGADTEAMAQAESLEWVWPVVTDRQVSLHRADESFIDNWNPLSGSLYEPDTYYKVEFKAAKTVSLPKPLILALLAGRFIPPPAMRWLLHDKQVYQQWWDVMRDNIKPHNAIAKILRKLRDTMQDNEVIETNENALQPPVSTETVLNHFVDWLKIQLNQQAITLNQDDSVCHRLESGVFVQLSAVTHDFMAAHTCCKATVTQVDANQSLEASLLQALQTPHGVIRNAQDGSQQQLTVRQAEGKQYLMGIVLPLKRLYADATQTPAISKTATLTAN